MKKYALIGALLFAQGGYVASIDGAIFPTLTQVQQYTESLPEHIETETDWLNPDFSLFHKERVPGRMRRLINWFGLGRRAWNPQEFNRLLHSLIKKRELNGLMGDFIQKYQELPGDRIFIWTDLFGAFHSLVRDLGELRSKGIIGDDFKIAKPEYLFVFNGNVIDHSPYVLETLTLVMRLLEVNPQQVIYTRGDHEDKQEWHSYGLARELKIRAAGLSREVIPLNKLMTKFFNTLPLGLFLPQVTEKEINVVLIANNEYSKSGFEVKKIAGFLEKEENGKLSSFKLSNKLTAKKSVHIKVLISGEDRSITYHQTPGLSMLGMQREALRWLSFSSPTSRNRRLYEFFNDAFIEIKILEQLDDWTITLYNQDVRKLFGFKKAATYDLLTGRRIKEGVKKPKKKAPSKEKKKKEEPPKEPPKKPVVKKEEKKPKKPGAKPLKEAKKKEEPKSTGTQEMVVGSTLDLSKSASMIGKPVKEGLDLAFKHITQLGGAGSFVPRIIMYDDGYTPSKTRSLVKDFLDKSNIDIFLNSVGSPTTESYLDLIKEGKVLVLFPYTGAPIFRKPELKSIAHMRVGYVDEGRALAEYALDELQARKIVIFYQNDAFGQGALQGAMEIFKKRGKEVIQVPYDRNDVQFDQQAKIIEQADPDTIFFFAVTPSARSLIRQLGVSFLRGRNLIGMSVYDDSFERFLESKGLKFLMVRVVPNPKTSELEIVKEYREAARGSNHVLNFNSLEAFINASIFFDILKRIKPPLTKGKIIKEIESIKNYNFKGIELDFDPNSRELVRTLWLDTGEGPWIKKEVRPSSDKRVAEEEKKAEAVEPPAEPKKEADRESKQKKEAEKPEKKEPKEEEKEPEELIKEKPVGEDGEKKPLTLGSTLDLTRAVKFQSKSVKAGIDLRLKEEREAGESVISQVIVVDDEYTPRKTVREVKRFLEQGIDILLTPMGSPTLAAYLDLVREGKVLVLFPMTGAPLFRKKDLKYMIHIRPSYTIEGKILTEYALDTLKAKKGVLFYQDDAFGQGLLEGAQEVLKEKGITNWLAVPYQRNDVTFAKQVARIKKYDPDVLLFFSVTTAARGLIRQLGIQELAAKPMLANSDFGEEEFQRFMKKKGLKMFYLNVVPNPQQSDIAIAKQFRDAANREGVPIDVFSLEAYLATDFLIDIVKKIRGAVTKEKIINAIAKVKNYNYKGLKFNFDPESRTLSSTLWMYTGSPDWQQIEVKSNKEDTQ